MIPKASSGRLQESLGISVRSCTKILTGKDEASIIGSDTWKDGFGRQSCSGAEASKQWVEKWMGVEDVNLLDEDHGLQTYDGEGIEVNTMVAGEDSMLKRIDYFVVRRKGDQSMLYSSGIELEERQFIFCFLFLY